MALPQAKIFGERHEVKSIMGAPARDRENPCALFSDAKNQCQNLGKYKNKYGINIMTNHVRSYLEGVRKISGFFI